MTKFTNPFSFNKIYQLKIMYFGLKSLNLQIKIL